MKVYNQNEFNTFWADCTIVTLYQIILSKYWVYVKYSFFDKTINSAINALVLFTGWAVFWTIYPWYVKRLSKILDLKLRIKKVSINSYEFADLTSKWCSWGIWLKNWNKAYLEAVSRWKITKKDIDAIKAQWWGFSHNHCYWKWVIQEVYRWKEVKCSLEVLRYWISKWVWWTPARTIEWADKFTRAVWDLLIEWKKDMNYDPYLDGKTSHDDILVNNKAWNMLQYKL